MFNSRWYFYAVNFGVFCKTGRLGQLGKLDGPAQIRMSSMNLRLTERCGSPVHVRGREHLRALEGRPVVLMGNHMSLLETGIFHAVAREYVDFAFVVKDSLMRVPYFKDILKAIGNIPVERKNPREDLKTVLSEGKRILQGGRSIIIFPQSTRSNDVDPEHFNTIGIKLAKSAGVPILPFALKTDFTKVGKLVRDMGPVNPKHEVWYEFFPAMEVEGNGHEQHKQIIELIKGRVDAWRKAENE
jgi:1-acyl-sn-glycerol-3-phosphate acyltransferase